MNLPKFFITVSILAASTVYAEEYTGPIIDMHVHAYEEPMPLFGMTHPPTMRNQTFVGATTPADLRDSVFSKFKQHNIVKAVVTHGDLWQSIPDIIVIAEAKKTPSELKQQHKENKLAVIAEMSPFYAGITADHPSQSEYFALAEELNIPVGFHVFPGGPNGGVHMMPAMLGKMRAKNANPLQLEDVLFKHPKLKLYIMHGGWPYVDDVKALMYMYPNLYVDISVINWALPEAALHDYLITLIAAGFGNRIMYGTDQMVWPDVFDVAIESVNNADFLTLEQKEDIFYDNAARFLGLSAKEIAKHKND